jgi:LacI family transcriptional regulator
VTHIGGILLEKLTIKSIARHFNVSAASVSKALNDQPDISTSLKQKIRQYAQENGYIPNMFGKGLRGSKHKVIGVILSDSQNPNNLNQLDAIETEAAKQEYSILLCSSREDWQIEQKHLNILLQKNVDGILVMPADNRNAPGAQIRYSMLEKAGVPYVLINRSLDNCPADTVKTDNISANFTANKYLFEHNHMNIIHFTSEMETSPVDEKILGFQQAHEYMGVAFREENIFRCNTSSAKSCFDAMLKILDSRSDFTAVLTQNDLTAFPVIKAILYRGLRIPQDIAVFGTDNNPFADTCTIPLTTLSQNNYRVGQLAVELLISRISGAYVGAQRIYLLQPNEIIERDSV